MPKDLALVVLMIAILALMVIPLPTALIDVLLAANISLAVLLLIVAVYLKKPSDFVTFPSVILIGTAFRLSLSIATTRLILADADAGQIIETFGEFVIQGSIVIGLVIFLIITVVQFVVVTKGSERVAEVSARFALDSMPGKQMSIEADLRAGTIDQEEGARKRMALNRESSFYGSMDGAMKFVKGDAIAGIIIILINLVGGITIGTAVHGFSLGEALSIYALLTIGDGLVAQIPALLMSLCAGTIVTRITDDESSDLGTDIVSDLLSNARVPLVAGVVILGIGFIPGFPLWIFATASVLLFSSSFLLNRARLVAEAVPDPSEVDDASKSSEGETLEDAIAAHDMPVSDRIGLRIGEVLAEELDQKLLNSEINARIFRFAERYGIDLAFPYLSVSMGTMPPRSFQIELDEVPVLAGGMPEDRIVVRAQMNELLALGVQSGSENVVTWGPIRNPLRFIPAANQEKLVSGGIEVIQPESLLAERILRQYEQNLGLLFARPELETLMKRCREVDNDLAEALIQKFAVSEMMMVFRYLLEDGVPLRPLRLMMDSFAHWASVHKDPTPLLIAECMRGSLKRQLSHAIAGADGVLGIIMLAPALQTLLTNAVMNYQKVNRTEDIDGFPLEPDLIELIKGEFRVIEDREADEGRQIAVVAPANIRRRMRSFLVTNGFQIPVLSPHELSDEITTIPLEVIGKGL